VPFRLPSFPLMMKKSNQTKNIWLKSERLFLATVSDSASMKTKKRNSDKSLFFCKVIFHLSSVINKFDDDTIFFNNNKLPLQLGDAHDVVLFYRQYDFYLLFKLHEETKPSDEHFIKEIYVVVA